MPVLRKNVFISAHPNDKKWVEKLQIMLAPSLQKEQIAIWTIDKIRPGSVRQEEHAKAMATTRVAILLVTADLLASDFIIEKELPQFLQASEAGEISLLWIAVGASMYKLTALVNYKPLNNPICPLDSLSPSQLNQELVKICEKIIQKATYLTNTRTSPVSSQQEEAFSLDLISQESHREKFFTKADVLLVTVTKTETQAILDLFPQWRLSHRGNLSYHLLGEVAGAKICLVQSGMGKGGPSGAILTVQEAITAFSPSAVIMVGIAFGVNQEEQRIGDILISRQIADYELQRISTFLEEVPRIIPRGDRPSASTRLLSVFNAAVYTWESPPQIYFGLLLSGDKLVDNKDFRHQLISHWPDAIGGEMEGAGLYAAAQREKIDWIIVKSISDWADGRKKQGEEDHQQEAAFNAAQFLLHVLSSGGFASLLTTN